MSELTPELDSQLKKLRAPFEANQISKLPKPYKKDAEKGKCNECGGFHGLPAMHLDYVGHAALTDRLLEVDPLWSWKPLALTPEGLPRLDADKGMWIELTVCGVTRLGYGDATGKTGANATKEIIGDALRNAGMRFGMALDLWHKGILHMDVAEEETQATAVVRQQISGKTFDKALAAVKAGEYSAKEMKGWYLLTDDQEIAITDAEKEAKK